MTHAGDARGTPRRTALPEAVWAVGAGANAEMTELRVVVKLEPHITRGALCELQRA